MHETNQAKFKSLYMIIGVICLFIFAGIVFWQYQKPDRKSGANDQNQTQNNTADNNQNSTDSGIAEPQSKADNLFQKGATELTAKNYGEAIQYFDQAIAENAYEPQYYSDKSEAQYNLGQKQAAIDTLRTGSSLNPDSDLLKSKLDVLTKQFDNSNVDAARE